MSLFPLDFQINPNWSPCTNTKNSKKSTWILEQDGDWWACANHAIGRAGQPCLHHIWSMRATNSADTAATIPSAIWLQCRPVRPQQQSQQTPGCKQVGSGMHNNIEIYWKHSIQPQVSCGGAEAGHACPHIWWGDGPRDGLGAPHIVSCAAQGPCGAHNALRAPHTGAGLCACVLTAPPALHKQRNGIAFHFNKSQMMPSANYQNGAKVKNPLNYNTCHRPKLLWLTVLWEIH